MYNKKIDSNRRIISVVIYIIMTAVLTRGQVLMMRVYICPDCGWMRMVSRRKNVECYKCGVQDMTLAKVDFATYVSWSEKERQEYSAAWMYIHNKGKIKRN